MRRTCQVYARDAEKVERLHLCEEPAVDFVEIVGNDPNEITRIWMCAKHYDEHMRKVNERFGKR